MLQFLSMNICLFDGSTSETDKLILAKYPKLNIDHELPSYNDALHERTFSYCMSQIRCRKCLVMYIKHFF